MWPSGCVRVRAVAACGCCLPTATVLVALEAMHSTLHAFVCHVGCPANSCYLPHMCTPPSSSFAVWRDQLRQLHPQHV